MIHYTCKPFDLKKSCPPRKLIHLGIIGDFQIPVKWVGKGRHLCGVPNVNYIRAEIIKDFPIWPAVPNVNYIRTEIIEDFPCAWRIANHAASVGQHGPQSNPAEARDFR